MRALRNAYVAGLLALVIGAAGAQVIAEPLPGDPHLVVFPYDENNSYRILARPLAVTDIVLESDEKLKVLVLGDTLGWQTAKNGNHVFIKPVYAGRNTSGTLVTSKRSYQLMLISTNEAGRWYQRVSFQYPDLVAAQEIDDDRARLAADGDAPAIAKTARPDARDMEPSHDAASGEPEVDAAALNFQYKITGDAPFKPLNVYDDGHSTFIKLPKAEDIPALFRVNKSGEAELVDYALRHGDVLVVPRILDAGMLKIGKEEVLFYNLTRVKRGFFGSIDLGN